ncbi:hypothetical protein [Wolbachia endosymbiont (group A) of Conops quadrifasciatus]|uniref:hypothetical protein n=1 Tax=Wolbachia endosymbiont (group A) of Conops quadrifasciatus TaxID=3066143 RepID=UPI0031329EC0
MKTLRNANEKDIIYELAYGELTSKDKEKLLKLARKIEEGKGIAEKFKNGVLRKSHYNTKKILATKITYGNETFTLLDHAKLYKNDQAVNDILQEAKKQKLSELACKQPPIKQQTLPSTVTIETAIDTGTTIVEEENSEKILNLNTTAIEYQNTAPEIDDTETISTNAKLCENINESSEDLYNIEKHQLICKNNKEALKNITASTEAAMQELLPSIEIIIEDQTLSCSYSKSEKESAVNEKEGPLTKAMQQRRAVMAGSVGAVLLVSSVISYALKMYTIAVVGGIIGLACISFALYNVLKPGTKLEEVKKIEQFDVKPFSDSKGLTA